MASLDATLTGTVRGSLRVLCGDDRGRPELALVEGALRQADVPYEQMDILTDPIIPVVQVNGEENVPRACEVLRSHGIEDKHLGIDDRVVSRPHLAYGIIPLGWELERRHPGAQTTVVRINITPSAAYEASPAYVRWDFCDCTLLGPTENLEIRLSNVRGELAAGEFIPMYLLGVGPQLHVRPVVMSKPATVNVMFSPTSPVSSHCLTPDPNPSPWPPRSRYWEESDLFDALGMRWEASFGSLRLVGPTPPGDRAPQ